MSVKQTEIKITALMSGCPVTMTTPGIAIPS